MPENEFFKFLRPLSFTDIKKELRLWAESAGERMSVRDAKGIAGQIVNASDADDYKRIIHGDPVGEGVARRWYEFKHNTVVAA